MCNSKSTSLLKRITGYAYMAVVRIPVGVFGIPAERIYLFFWVRRPRLSVFSLRKYAIEKGRIASSDSAR